MDGNDWLEIINPFTANIKRTVNAHGSVMFLGFSGSDA